MLSFSYIRILSFSLRNIQSKLYFKVKASPSDVTVTPCSKLTLLSKLKNTCVLYILSHHELLTLFSGTNILDIVKNMHDSLKSFNNVDILIFECKFQWNNSISSCCSEYDQVEVAMSGLVITYNPFLEFHHVTSTFVLVTISLIYQK